MSTDAHMRGPTGPPLPPAGDGFCTVGHKNYSDINKNNTFVLGIKAAEMSSHGITSAQMADTLLVTPLVKCAIEARVGKKTTLSEVAYWTFTVYNEADRAAMLAAPLELVRHGGNGREDPATAHKYAVFDLTRNVKGGTYHTAAMTNLPASAGKSLPWTVLSRQYPNSISEITPRMFRGITAATIGFNNLEAYTAFVMSKTMVIGSSCPRIFPDFDFADAEYEADRHRTLYAHVVPRNLFPMDLLRTARTKFGNENVTSAYMVPANYNPHKYRLTGGLRFVDTAARNAAMAMLKAESAGVWKDIGPKTILTQIPDMHACFLCECMGHEAHQCTVPRPPPRPTPQHTAHHPKPAPASRITPSAMHQGHPSPVVGATWVNRATGKAPVEGRGASAAALVPRAAVSPRSAPSMAAVTTPGLARAFVEMGAILAKQIFAEVRNGNMEHAQHAVQAFDDYKAHMGVHVSDEDVTALLLAEHSPPAPAPAPAPHQAAAPAPAPRQSTAPPHAPRHNNNNATTRRPDTDMGLSRNAKKARTTKTNPAAAAAAIMALEAAASTAAKRLAKANDAIAAQKVLADEAKARLDAARAASPPAGLMTLNVCGLRDLCLGPAKLQWILDSATRQGCGMIALQETFLTKKTAAYVLKDTKGWYARHSFRKDGAQQAGVSLLLRTGFSSYHAGQIKLDGYVQGEAIRTSAGMLLWIISVYIPPSTHQTTRLVSDFLLPRIDREIAAGHQVVVTGDLNTRSSAANRTFLCALLERGLLDVADDHGMGDTPTRAQAQNDVQGHRLDYTLATPDALARVEDFDVDTSTNTRLQLPGVRSLPLHISDHFALVTKTRWGDYLDKELAKRVKQALAGAGRVLLDLEAVTPENHAAFAAAAGRDLASSNIMATGGWRHGRRVGDLPGVLPTLDQHASANTTRWWQGGCWYGHHSEWHTPPAQEDGVDMACQTPV
ncbi:hypothetical protein BC828DRAFT_409448 [Blastocladiella britannica]|nr:hypothetical protein BC828DRAFT_409448 [Blastocladiella britannica]